MSSHFPTATTGASGQSHTWEVVGDEVSQAVGTALEPVLERARDNLYGALLDTVQDYLSENLAFNIASRISAANREARQLRVVNAELLDALKECAEALDCERSRHAAHLGREPEDIGARSALKAADAAIAKAKAV